MSLRISSRTKIFVMCPANVVTGGPESLHQMVDMLGRIGRDAYLVYDSETAAEVASDYKKYSVKQTAIVEDESENILIVPEIWTYKLRQYKNIQKCIWWLSVDFYLSLDGSFSFKSVENSSITHLCHSYYAKQFLRKKGLKKTAMVSSYLNQKHIRQGTVKPRGNKVLYNPKKGRVIMNMIMKQAPDIDWFPIEKRSAEQVAELMRTSKVYVDFGHFPGKERMPREAILNGCCIVVGKRGAAANAEDLPLSDNYKFAVSPLWRFRKFYQIPRIIKRVRDCLNNYESKVKDFQSHRQTIIDAENIFKKQAEHVFALNTSTASADPVIKKEKTKEMVSI